MADFMAKWTEPQSQADIKQEPPWLVYCDRAWGNTGARATTVLTLPSGIKLHYTTRFQFTSNTNKCTKNITEYEAILLGLQKLRAIGVETCVLHTDSKVMSGQIEEECIAREPTLAKYLAYRGNLPWVLRPLVTAQNSWIRSVPSSSIWLGNHPPHTRKQSHLYR
jgi:ribonuclease HI